MAPNTVGVLIIDETGDLKDGSHTAHVGRQYLGNVGKIGNGVVSVSSHWADERIYYPLEVAPYTPASRFEQGKKDPLYFSDGESRAGEEGLNDRLLASETTNRQAEFMMKVRKIQTTHAAQFNLFEILPRAFVRIQVRCIAGQLLEMNLPRAVIAQKVFYIVTTMNGRTIPNDQQLLFKTLNQAGQKQDTLRAAQSVVAQGWTNDRGV